MKGRYVEIARQYLANHPEYAQSLDELKFQLKLIGIPENQLNGVISDLSKDIKISGVRTFPISGGRFIFLIVYLALISGMLYMIFFFKFPVRDNKISQALPSTPKPQAHQFLPQDPAGGIVRKVYANEIPVKVEQVFSYPVQNISQAPSVRPKREVVGFIPYWTINSLDKLRLDEVTTANLFGIEADGAGNLIITDTHGNNDGGWSMWNDPRLPGFIDTLKKKQVKVGITIKMFSNPHIDSLMASPQGQNKLISNILYMVGSKNLDGVNLDFEYLGSNSDTTRLGFTNFVNTLNTELKKEYPTSFLTIDTYASSGVTNDMFDLSSLSKLVDEIIIMGYDFHTPYSSPGPVAPLTGEQSIASYLANYLTRVPSDKLVLAVPYYGYDWVSSDSSPNSTNILSYADISAANSNNVQWDSVSQTPWYQYLDESGKTHKVYFDNVRSLGLKYDLVNERNLKGIGVWAVGYEGLHNELDQLISQKFGF